MTSVLKVVGVCLIVVAVFAALSLFQSTTLAVPPFRWRRPSSGGLSVPAQPRCSSSTAARSPLIVAGALLPARR